MPSARLRHHHGYLGVNWTAVKIYIYEASTFVRKVHADYRRHRLRPYLQYLDHLRAFFTRFQTRDPDEADFFFVPLSLISFQFSNRQRQFRDPYPFVKSLPYIGRKPHLLFAAGDFGQRRHAAYETTCAWRAYPQIYPWLDDRFILLAFESTADLLPQDIALFPYVLPPSTLRARLRKHLTLKACRERNLLYSFAGVVKYLELSADTIRGGLFDSAVGVTADSFVGSAREAEKRYGQLRGSDIGMFKRSVFTLCPAGFGRWSFRFIQAPVYGSIPVLMSDGYIKPFSQYIAWDKFTLTVPEAEVMRVPDLLRSLPQEKIVAYQEQLAAMAPLLERESMHQMLLKELRLRSNRARPMAAASETKEKMACAR